MRQQLVNLANKSQKLLAKSSLSLLLIAYSLFSTAQIISTDKNAVIHSKARVSTTNLADLDDPTKATIAIKYEDGLGRHLQTIGYRQSPTMQDIVLEAFEFDGVGRRVKAYLPSPSYEATGEFRYGMASSSSNFYQDTAPFSQVRSFDNSPLNRPVTQYEAGQAWRSNQKYTEVLQNNNKASDQVRLYRVDASGVASAFGYYPSGRMFKRIAYNEHRHKVVEFIDKQQNILERWVMDGSTGSDTTFMKTAYIYDDIGRLRYVVQPQAYDNATTVSVNSSDFGNFIFAYRYDTRGRVIRKHIPNGGWTDLVYDYLNRPVLEQSAQQAAQYKWSFTKYDGLGRVITKGELTNTNTRDYLQGLFTTVSTPYEVWQNGNYTNQSYPIPYNFVDEKQRFFYDTYSWVLSSWSFNASLAYDANNYWPNANGKATGSWARSPEDPYVFFTTVLYYDNRDRIMQTHQTHHKGGSQNWTKPVITNFQYNFAGDVLNEKITYQLDNQPTTTTLTTNEVDNAGRLLKVYHSINGIAPVEILRMTYDEIGRLTQKKIMPNGTYLYSGIPDYINRPPNPNVGIDDVAKKAICLLPGTDISNTYSATIDPNANSGTPISGLQTIQYAYHIRGGLKGINLDASGNAVPNAGEGDLFSYKLDYETANQWDGNIGKQTWRNDTESQRSYLYTYDPAKRLKSATYQGIGTENFSIPNMSYDKNGNITNLQRKGSLGGSTYDFIDNLTYHYGTSGNQLQGVTDNVNGNLDVGDFRDNGSSNDYTYWADGSLKSDANKGISLIEYDTFLKKVKQVTWSDGRWLKFFYDGSGKLLKRQNSMGDVWEYVGAMIFKNGVPYQLSTPEGRAVYTNGTWNYEFEYRDHQNNLRVAFTAENGQLVQTQSSTQDPWGLEIQGLSSITGVSPQKFQFQNQEKIDDFGLNWNFYKYRFEDAQLGRFFQIDPLSEKYVHNSVYAFSENKVINHVELEGLEAVSIQALRAPSVQNHVKKANSAGREILSFSGGFVIGGAGVDLKIGKVGVKVEGSIIESELSVSNKPLQSEIKLGNAALMLGSENLGIGGEFNTAKIETEGGNKSSKNHRQSESLMSTELNVGSGSSELKTNELELGLTFGTFTGKIKANFDKAKEYLTESASAIGAYVTEVFNVSTNQSFTAKDKDKNEKK